MTWHNVQTIEFGDTLGQLPEPDKLLVVCVVHPSGTKTYHATTFCQLARTGLRRFMCWHAPLNIVAWKYIEEYREK